MRVEEGCSLAMVGEKTGSEAAEEGRGAAAGEKVCTAGEEHQTVGAAEEDVLNGCSIAGEATRKLF